MRFGVSDNEGPNRRSALERSMSTEGGRAEEALTSGEQDLRLLVEAIPTLVWRAAPEGNIDYVNKRVLDYFGAPLSELIGWGWMDKVHPDDVAFKVRTWLQNLEPGKPHDAVCRFRGADGKYRWFEVRGEPRRASDGKVLRWYGVLVDIDDQRRAEEALRESEQRFRDYAQTASDWYWETDPDHKFTLITVCERLVALGFAPMGRIGLTRWDYATDVKSEPEKWELHRSLLEARQPFRDFVYQAARSDGSLGFYKTNGKPIYDQEGAFLGYRGTGSDVTATMRAEAALHESEYKLRRIIETVPGLVWSAGAAGEPNYANQRLLDYTGTPLGDFKYRNWQRFLHPDDLPESVRAFDHAVQTGRSYEAVLRLRRSDGEYRWHHVRGEPLRDRQGHIIQWYGLSVDIHEGKKAEDRLRRSEAHLAEAQRLSRTGSSVYSETAILYWSEEAFRIWGFDPAQGLPSREAKLQRIHPDDRDRHHRETTDSLREKRDCSIEFRIVLPDGTVKDVEKIYHPVFSTSGELVEIVASGIDVTERKRAEEEHERLRQLELDLAHMNRLSMMGELAASLAHEITQPIAAARNNARAALNFLDQQPPDLGEVGEALGCVVGDADRAGLIVDRIRDHIKKAPPRKHRFDLNEAINEVIVLARTTIAENGVSVQTHLTEGLAPVEGDRVQLQQVILNLALNAVEAMSAVDEGARELLISSKQSQTNGVRVTVRDTGPGIDPEHIERVFEAFYTTKSSGVGMGLSICRSIIEAHGGRLWADANEPRGAVFQFTLHPQSSS
jgi:PAS domain S-box-containing protein